MQQGVEGPCCSVCLPTNHTLNSYSLLAGAFVLLTINQPGSNQDRALYS